MPDDRMTPRHAVEAATGLVLATRLQKRCVEARGIVQKHIAEIDRELRVLARKRAWSVVWFGLALLGILCAAWRYSF